MTQHGSRIPPSFRTKVSTRIRCEMNKVLGRDKGYGNPFFSEAANRIGISGQAVWCWYTGQTLPTIYNLTRLADVLELTIDELVGRKVATEIKRRTA